MSGVVMMAATGRDGTWTKPLPVQTAGECEIGTTTTSDTLVRGESASALTSSSTDTDQSIPDMMSTAEMVTDNNEPVITLRMLMNSKDVGSIIGKAGMTIKAFREQSGAKINISNGTSSERLVTVTGTKSKICKAFSAIGSKIQQDIIANRSTLDTETTTSTDQNATNISFRLIIQTSQCGSLIGKGGTKIKEIRESTGASIQIAGETLPNSTERAVQVSGLPEAITVCIQLICDIIIENPPKGPFIAYKPHTLPNQAYQPRHSLPFQTPYTTTAFNTTVQPTTTVQHMRIPNDLIGCVIGRKGTKIHEIRVNSGAMIKIAGNERDGTDRLVTISGTPESVGIAQYLINSRIHSEVNTFLSVGLNTV